MQNHLLNLLQDEPPLFKNYAHVKFRNNFAKQWYELKNNNSIYADTLLNLIESPFNIQYEVKDYSIALYLPIEPKYLSKQISENVVYLQVNPTHGDTKSKTRKKMFTNFLHFLDSVNFDYSKENQLLEKLIIRLMKWDEKSFTNLVLSSGILYKPLILSSENDSNILFNMLKENWQEIWTVHEPKLKTHYINSKFSDPHMIFEVLEILLNNTNPKVLPQNLVDDRFTQIMNDISKFSPYYSKAKQIVNNLQYLTLYAKTQDIKNPTINKNKKI